MAEQTQSTSPDAFIQEQQRQRVNKIKRLFFILAILLAVACAVAIGVALKSDSHSDNGSADAVQAELSEAYSSAEQEAAREAFKQALAAFEAQHTATLVNIAQIGWQSTQLSNMNAAKERALALFANAGFVQALGELNKLDADVDAFILGWHQAHKDKLAQAESLYQQEQIQQARLALSQADKIKPQHESSQHLRSRLAVYEQVQGYFAQLKVARVENNLENQVALMQKIITADPSREDIKAPLEDAVNRLNQQRLGFALQKAEQALQRDDINEATTYLKQAEIIQASAKGIAALRAALDKKLAMQGLVDIKQRVKQLQSDDAWQQVAKLVEQSRVRFPKDAELLEAGVKANKVLSAQQSMNRFILRPERLAEPNIRAAAQEAIKQSISLLPESKALAQSAQSLAGLIDRYSAKMPVTVRSDGQTHITVIGVGIVGKVEEKTIELTPGNYIFEGKRTGYRTKRLSVEVGFSDALELVIKCDEQI
ncbi:hypothetical protein ACFO4O_13215 [Glaciecola siphonariae]|uniref:Uncharacterized protein n=1 Tax=Glaciecola siphonariae TaxID=521012 RepID=A0ABV9LX46_9ALTE